MPDMNTTQTATATDKAVGVLTIENIDELWDAANAERAAVAKRTRYYAGNHAIVGRDKEYPDGKKAAEIVTNWPKYIVDMWTGAFSNAQLTQKDMATAQEDTAATKSTTGTPLDTYALIAESNHLALTDIELRRTALKCGSAIEVHSYNAEAGAAGDVTDAITITRYDPAGWVLVEDAATGETVIAINRVELPSGTVRDGDYLEKPITVQTVYTDTEIAVYEKTKDQATWTLKEDAGGPHSYGRVPVFAWRMNETGDSVLTDAMLTQVDEYNDIDSASGDEIRAHVAAMLKLIGVDADWVNENAALIKGKGVIALPEGAMADYMSRVLDSAPSIARLTRTRKHIHMMAEVPDVGEMVGATGSTSGIALKLAFEPMERGAEPIAEQIKSALRTRIDLINVVLGHVNRDLIEDYVITIQFRAPVNSVEQWREIVNLKDLLSERSMLELLDDVSDPERELTRLDEERMKKRADTSLLETASPGAQIARKERMIVEAGDQLAASIDEPIMKMSEQITAAFTAMLARASAEVTAAAQGK